MKPTRRPQPDDGDPGIPAWMTTFSDCMTLLLTFFVLLLSFSSFDDAARAQLEGAFEQRQRDSVSDSSQLRDDTLLPEPEYESDYTREGSEQPTREPPRRTLNPRRREPIINADAYKDVRVLTMPASKLFYGGGAILTPRGRSLLKRTAEYMKFVPCHVIVSAAPSRAAAGDGEARSVALRRAMTVMDDLIGRGLDAGRFRLSDADPADADAPDATVRLAMYAAPPGE